MRRTKASTGLNTCSTRRTTSGVISARPRMAAAELNSGGAKPIRVVFENIVRNGSTLAISTSTGLSTISTRPMATSRQGKRRTRISVGPPRMSIGRSAQPLQIGGSAAASEPTSAQAPDTQMAVAPSG